MRNERTFVREERTFVREERTFVRDEGMSRKGRGHESREPTFRATVVHLAWSPRPNNY